MQRGSFPRPHPDPPMKSDSMRRRRKLIKARLQLRLVGAFAGLAALAMLLQFLVLGYLMTTAAAEIEGGGGELAAAVPGALLVVLGFSALILLPCFVGLGVIFTFRIAGPVHRFEQFLDNVAAGQQIGPCRIRDADDLHSLCEAINRATEPLRRRTSEDEPMTVDASDRLSA